MNCKYVINKASAFYSVLTSLDDDQYVDSLIMPSSLESTSSTTRRVIDVDRGSSSTLGKSEYVKPSTVEEMNSTMFRQAAANNLEYVKQLEAEGKNKKFEALKNWAKKSPVRKLRIYFGGDFVPSDNWLELLGDLAASVPNKTVYVRTTYTGTIDSIKNGISLPGNIIFGIESSSDMDDIPDNCVQIVYREGKDIKEDLQAFPEKGQKILEVQITEECKQCGTTNKPWWDRLDNVKEDKSWVRSL